MMAETFKGKLLYYPVKRVMYLMDATRTHVKKLQNLFRIIHEAIITDITLPVIRF
jgi:hypothetical protein